VDVGPLVISHAQAAEKGGKTCSWEQRSFLKGIAWLPDLTSKQRIAQPVGRAVFYRLDFTEVVYKPIVYRLSDRAPLFLFLVM